MEINIEINACITLRGNKHISNWYIAHNLLNSLFVWALQLYISSLTASSLSPSSAFLRFIYLFIFKESCDHAKCCVCPLFITITWTKTIRHFIHSRQAQWVHKLSFFPQLTWFVEFNPLLRLNQQNKQTNKQNDDRGKWLTCFSIKQIISILSVI